MRLNFVKWGLAYRVGSDVFLNNHLRESNLKVRELLLWHEFQHSNKDGLAWKDWLLDLKPGFTHPLIWRFILSHPSTWSQFIIPFSRTKEGWHFDIVLLSIQIGVVLCGLVMILLLG